MKKTWLLALGLGLGVAAFAPAVHADDVAVGLNVNLGADDAAHFDFRQGVRHEPRVYKAAWNLQQAKHILWNSPNQGPRREQAIERLNQALDQLRWAEGQPRGPERREAVRRAFEYARWSRRALAHSWRGEGRRDALGYLDQGLRILDNLVHRY